MLDLLETRCSVCFAICCIAHICMTDMTSLISFLLISFILILLAAFVVYQQNWVNNTTSNSLKDVFSVNHIQVGSFQGCSQIAVQKCPFPFPKICHTYPTMMKLSAFIPYLTKIRNIYKSRDTLINFCRHQYFFTKISIFSYIKKYRYRLHFNT